MFKRSSILAIALAIVAVASPAAAAADDDDFCFVYFPHEDVESHFSNDWGDARSGGRGHKGTDVFGEKGSAVVTVADGFITTMKHSPRAGYNVRIEHQDGWETWYLHLNNDTVGTDDGAGGIESAFPPGLEEGMFVPAGTVVGYVGDSGNAEGSSSHTHFELHTGRTAINPYPYLAASYERWMRVIELADKLR